MDNVSLVPIIILLFLMCVLIILIIKIKNKKYLTIPLIIILGLTLCTLVTYPNYVSMQERKWSHEELPTIFMDISKKNSSNDKLIVLNDNYKTKLREQYEKLRRVYGSKDAKKKIISILSYVLETELPKSGENIDTMLLFDKFNKIINDTLLAHNIK